MAEPSNPVAVLHREIARLVARGDLKGASATLDRALQRAPRHAPLYDAIGTLYSSIGEQRKAADAYSQAISVDPRRADYWFNRAAVLRFLGQLEQAEKDYDQAIRLRPDDYEAYLNRSELRTQSDERNHIQALEQLLTRTDLPWQPEVQLRYALAKEFEDLGRYHESWQHLERGARLRRDHLQYDIRRDLDTVRWITEAFPTVTAAAVDGAPGPRPIFIVGLPRSGSTLIERILGSHSDVFAAGELNHFALVLTAAAQPQSGGRPMPRKLLIEATRAVDFTALGEAYLGRVCQLNFAQGHFTDKMPLNYLYCGLIAKALPQARIVHVTRQPMAACYAMFKTLFKDGYPFSYDLDEIAQFYAGYRRLMRHWHEAMPGFIYDISYERLVLAQEEETRRLLSACGLDWQGACLKFHTNPQATRTASASQVRRPLYDSALKVWRHYEPQLEGLKSRLVAAGIDAQQLV